jgi:2'-5' RNA ligase
VYSLNVPVPDAVVERAERLRPDLAPFASIRETHTCVLKRLGDDDPDTIERRVRAALDTAPAFECRTAGVDTFDDPPLGSAPVVYLPVEAPVLTDLHRRLGAAFPAVEGIEGAGYTPHVTLARGGPRHAAAALQKRRLDPLTWTVTELELFDAERRVPERSISLPL